MESNFEKRTERKGGTTEEGEQNEQSNYQSKGKRERVT